MNWKRHKYKHHFTLGGVTGPQVDKSTKFSVDKAFSINSYERHNNESTESWTDLNEFIESDFLISSVNMYPSQKVDLKDAEVSERLWEEQQDAF